MKIIVTGRLKEEYYRKIENELSKIILKKTTFEVIELNDEKIPQNSNDKLNEKILIKEGERILEKIKKTDYVVSLCIEGKEIKSEYFKNNIVGKHEDVVFVIGGSLGLSEDVKKRSNMKISFSRMTFTHQMMRIVLIEEINKCYL